MSSVTSRSATRSNARSASSWLRTYLRSTRRCKAAKALRSSRLMGGRLATTIGVTIDDRPGSGFGQPVADVDGGGVVDEVQLADLEAADRAAEDLLQPDQQLALAGDG